MRIFSNSILTKVGSVLYRKIPGIIKKDTEKITDLKIDINRVGEKIKYTNSHF